MLELKKAEKKKTANIFCIHIAQHTLIKENNAHSLLCIFAKVIKTPF
jgi:hypothetical protein